MNFPHAPSTRLPELGLFCGCLYDSVVYCMIALYRWICVIAESIGDLIVFFAALFVILQRDTIDGGTVGLSLSFALQVNLNAMLISESFIGLMFHGFLTRVRCNLL